LKSGKNKASERLAENIVRTRLVLGALAVAVLRPAAPEPAVEEYRVKGAYLINFAKFVEWPESTFKGPGDPIALCILGASPFSPALDVAAHSVVVAKHPVVIRQIPGPLQARHCQIVFVSAAERRHARALLRAVQGGNVLTVGETEGFVADGGVIELNVEDGKVTMEINTAGAKKAGLLISAKLLSLAQPGNK
jgi:hypothetical protein